MILAYAKTILLANAFCQLTFLPGFIVLSAQWMATEENNLDMHE